MPCAPHPRKRVTRREKCARALKRLQDLPPDHGSRGRSALVVDDAGIIRFLMCSCLKRLGFSRVDLAANGLEALDRLADNPPDVVFTDYHMPVMDGGAFVANVREVPTLGKLPVVLLTSGNIQEDTWRNLGFTEYLRKPFSWADLMVLVSRLER